MDLQKLQRVVVDALEDVKAQDIKVFNTVGLSDMFDRVILASGTSNRQARALAWSVVEKVKEAGGQVVSVEGTDPGEWVLVDLGDIVVHVMQPAIRQYYGLEEMWGSKPVKVKLASEMRGNRPDRVEASAAAPATGAAPRAPTRKPGAAKAPAKKPAAKKAAAKKPAVKKSAARTATVKKGAARKTAATGKAAAARPVVRKGSTARKSAAKKPAAHAAPARKAAAPAKKAVKSVLKKSAAKRVAKKLPARPAAKAAKKTPAARKSAAAKKPARAARRASARG